MIGFLAILIVVFVFVISWYLFRVIYPPSEAPYKVLSYNNEDGELSYESFWDQSKFYEYLSKHQIAVKSSSVLIEGSSAFYYEKDGRGQYFEVAPNTLQNFGDHDETVSSVRTHPYGNYTLIYEHKNGQGAILALANTGDLYNIIHLTTGENMDWNDAASSTLVLSNYHSD